MCVILPVHHHPCTHTVAIWQSCIDAPRSKAYGLKPCRKIRQCSRPIVTRKKCINCGGPRFFARRGGVAERGSASQWILDESDEVVANDSGYLSDAIPEEDELEGDDDLAISPRAAPRVSHWSNRRRESIDEVISPRSSVPHSKQQQSINRRPSWRPNLKRDLIREQDLFPRNDAVDSHASSYIEDNIGKAMRFHWPSLDASPSPVSSQITPPRRPALPPIDTTASQRPKPPIRKSSTLLHPSSPPTPPNGDVSPDFAVSPNPPVLKAEASAISLPIRKSSTLLHPSSPPTDPPNMTQSAPLVPTLSTMPKRPILPPRKASTLLHPSSPPDERPTNPTRIYSYQMRTSPTSSHSYHSSDSSLSSASSTSSKANTPNFSLKGAKTRVSVLHSALSDSESEYSDLEIDNACCEDENGGDSEGEVMVVEAIVATAARMARASRVEFQGAHWRSISPNA